MAAQRSAEVQPLQARITRSWKNRTDCEEKDAFREEVFSAYVVERLGDGSFSTTRKKRPVPHPGTGNMSTTDAEKKRDEFMRTLNGSQEPDSDGTRPLKLREFIEQQYLPFCRKKWKASTAGTSEDRIRPHIIADIADRTMREFSSLPPVPFGR